MTGKRTQKRPKYIWIAGVLAVVLALALLLAFGAKGKTPEDSDAVARGKAYLASLTQKDPDAVRKIREEIFMGRMAAQKEELTYKIMNGEEDPFPLLQDYMILGDSRAVGFWYNEFLAQDRVLADAGNTIRAIPDRIEQLVQSNPRYVFLCYGLNDISIGYWNTAEEYAQEYMSCVAMIQEALPDATIVVSSIIPAMDPAFERSSRWRWIPDWNVVLEQTCAQNGILYANCDFFVDSYPWYWASDGIHFRPSLYPFWGGMLIVTALYGEMSYEG